MPAVGDSSVHDFLYHLCVLTGGAFIGRVLYQEVVIQVGYEFILECIEGEVLLFISNLKEFEKGAVLANHLFENVDGVFVICNKCRKFR